MQSVNDDMDELFRRAAENYPLDTKSADWNKVLAALQGQTEAKTISEKKENKNGRLLWLLLLLPLGLICNQLYSPGILNDKEISKTEVVKENPVPEKTSVQQDYTGNDIDRNNNIDVTGIKQESQDVKKESSNSFDLSAPLQKTYSSNSNALKRNAGHYGIYSDAFSNSRQITNKDNTGYNFADEEAFYQRKYVTGIASQKTLPDEFTTVVNRNFDPLIKSQEQNKKQPVRVARRKKFYIGLMGGVDATTVKFQKIENAGFTYGALFGYQFNKKWSVETGMYVEKKYYYSEGKYFNTSKIYMPTNSRIDDVSGDCKMIEVPVVVKYNFSSHKNSAWFATFGTSSYFMKKENYDYNYYYGSVGPVLHHKEYYNSASNLFSNLSLSAGYAHRLGNFADLRIEPYLKMPISGMGIGSLPLFSTGLQVGLTKKF